MGDRRPRGALGGLPARPRFAGTAEQSRATTSDELRAAENDLLEFRLTELRSQPRLVSRTYDLTHLQHLHFQLFQDIYEWAGDLRTVGAGPATATINHGVGDSDAPHSGRHFL